MIPLDITPLQPRAAQPNYDYIGDFAKEMDQYDQQKRQRQIEMLKAEMQHGVELGNLGVSQRNAATNETRAQTDADYKAMEADTHRMNIEDRKSAQSEKRLAQLHDAFRKAKTIGEKKLIQDEIRRAGNFTLEEAQSAAENTPGGDKTQAKGTIASGATVPGESPAPARELDADTGKWISGGPEASKGSPGANANIVAPTPADAENNPDVTTTGFPFQGPKGFKTPVPDAKFMAALDAEVQGSRSDAAQPTAGPTLSPFPWDQFGMPKPGGPPLPAGGEQLNDFRADPTARTGTPVDAASLSQDELPLALRQGGPKWNPETRSFDGSPPTGPTPPNTGAAPDATKGSGRYILKDKSGNVIDIWDSKAEEQQTRNQVMGFMAPLIGHAKTPQQKANAQEAADIAASAVETYGPQKAAEIGAANYFKLEKDDQENARVGQGQQRIDNKKGGKGGVAAPGIKSKEEMALDKEANDYVDKTIKTVNLGYDAKDSRKAMQVSAAAVAKLDDALKNPSGMMQLAALKDYMLSVSGKVVTDREMDQFLGSEGVWNEVKSKVAKYTDSGQMPPEFAQKLRSMLLQAASQRASQLKSAGDTVTQQILLAEGYTPEMKQRMAAKARGYFTGSYDAPAGPTKSGAPKSGGDDEAARRRKALEGL